MRTSSLLRRLTLVGLTLLSGACLGLDTEPAFGLLQSVVIEGQALEEFSRASGGTSALTVSGQLVGRLPCDVVRGSLKRKGTRFEITVTLDADSQGCNGLTPTTWSYVMNILNVDAGPQQIVVEHRFEGVAGQAGVVLDTVVTVR